MKFKYLITSLLLFFTFLVIKPSFAQDAAKNQLFVVNDFSQGLNTKTSPFAISKSQADIVENVRFDTNLKALTKRDETVVYGTADASEPILGMHRLYLKDGTKVLLVNHGDEIQKGDDSDGSFTSILTVGSPDRRWQWVTWHDIAIGTDGYNQPVKYDGTSASATYVGSALATDAGSGAGPDGTYTYKITCVTSSFESSMDVASNTVVVSDNDINLTMIPICPDSYLGETVTGRKVYRTGDSDSAYKLLTNGSIADNTTVTLTDSDTDAARGAALSPTDTNTTPKGRYIVVNKNRLWLANDPQNNPSTIYYSEDGSHDFFISDSLFNVRLNDGDEITCAKNLLGKLTICKNNTIQKINNEKDDPDTQWGISDPFSFIGCQAPYSAVNTTIGLIYLGNNGIYNFNGQYSTLISDIVTPEIRDIQTSNYANVWSAFFKNTYYMAYTSINTGSSVNDRILIYDLVDKAYSIDLFSVNVLDVWDSGTDVEALYSGSSGSGKIYAHTETVREIVHRRHSDFTGTFTDMRYIPTAVGGVAEDPVFEVAWTITIDSVSDARWSGTIDSVATAIIDRPDKDGDYISQALTVNASSFDKLFWNEVIPSGGGDVTFDMRTGSTSSGIESAVWTTGFTNSAGSDISALTGDVVVQYRANLTSDTITQTPNLFKANNYVVRFTYNTTGSTDETSVDLRWRSGWLDLGFPGYVKNLTKLYVYYDWPANTAGTLNIDWESQQGESDSFAIDLLANPDYYIDYFPDGSMLGELIRYDITESSLNTLIIKKIIVVFDVENLI